jgi:hypothetical protein
MSYLRRAANLRFTSTFLWYRILCSSVGLGFYMFSAIRLSNVLLFTSCKIFVDRSILRTELDLESSASILVSSAFSRAVGERLSSQVDLDFLSLSPSSFSDERTWALFKFELIFLFLRQVVAGRRPACSHLSCFS